MLFENVPIDDLTHIIYTFGTKGPDVQIKVFLDQLDGPLLQQVDLPFTSKSAQNIWEFQYEDHEYEINSSQMGRHDLIFELINTTQKAPQGLINLRRMQLVYEQQNIPPQKLKSKEKLLELVSQADRTPIMKAKKPGFVRTTRVFERGSRLTPTDTVQPGLPQTLSPQQENIKDRLELARWLTSEDNPLTARVMVNRFWEQLFGRGIVPTVEDFGTQAAEATHPHLLDHLAISFQEQHNGA